MSQDVDELMRVAGIYPDALADPHGSPKRFADGARYRIEIPSVEDPRCLAAVLDAAHRHDVPVTRVSQGSGTALLTDGEIADMVDLAADAGIELCLFIRPCAGWDVSAASRAAAGGAFAATTWGAAQLRFAINEMVRVAALGVRSVLIGDVGLLDVFGRLRADGTLPPTMLAKTSVMLPATNTATARLYARLGADTINAAPDLPVADLGTLRRAVDAPLDVYIEAPDDIGGFVRYHELAEIVRVAAPVYVKLGLRNAPLIYPSGSHLAQTAVSLSVERVRRARIALDILARNGITDLASMPRAAGLAVPTRPGQLPEVND